MNDTPPCTPEEPSRTEKGAIPKGSGTGEGTPRRRGRGRPARAAADSGPGARERILAKARAEFAERGYDKASVRGIAKAADVDPALVHHYFGTKDDVFAAAIKDSFDEPTALLPVILAGGHEGIGERLARYFVRIWENPASREPLLAVLRSALTNDAAAAVLRSFVLRRLLEQIARSLDVPDPTLRAELAASHMIGMAILRYVVGTEPLASLDPEEVVRMMAPSIQRYLTEA